MTIARFDNPGPAESPYPPMAAGDYIDIEVAYGHRQRQVVVSLRVPVGSSARAAIRMAQAVESLLCVDLEQVPIGVFGKRCSLETRLVDGDRLEIYRELAADPRQLRRRRTKRRVMGRG